MHRRDTLGWLVLLSLSLHGALFLVLLMTAATQPPPADPEPLAVDFIAEAGPKGTAPERPAPAEAAAASPAPSAPVPPAEVTPAIQAPASDVPPAPPDQA